MRYAGKVTSAARAMILIHIQSGRRRNDGFSSQLRSSKKDKGLCCVEERAQTGKIMALLVTLGGYENIWRFFVCGSYATFVPAHTNHISRFARVSVGLETANPYEVEPSLCGSGTDVYTHMGDVSPQSLLS